MENYTILSLKGEGSFGKVYKATDKSSKNIVALKVLSKRGRSYKDVQQLKKECDIQKDLKHPNIIQMLTSFETENEVVVVSEYAKLDLFNLLAREGALPEPKAQKLTFDLVSALYYLHSHRILHRDLKPQNILLVNEQDMTAKLCDFGFARNMTASTHVLTSIKGTPLYMSPELLECKPYDYMSDLWSLACIIYEVLVGEPPFYTKNILELGRLIRYGNIKYPSFLSPECHSFLDNLLVIDPTQRMTWPQILTHPFVEGNILILDENIPESPFTHPMNDEDRLEKERQAEKLMCPNPHLRHHFDTSDIMNISNLNLDRQGDENVTSSRDSINAILQSDLENIETDIEEVQGAKAKQKITKIHTQTEKTEPKNVCLVSGNSNLVLNHLNENFPQLSAKTIHDSVNESAKSKSTSNQLEKRKLTQNLDNFTVKLGTNLESADKTRSKIERQTGPDKNKTEPEDLHKETPTLLPGWDSCEDARNPPIENEEWLVFIHRTMQEILDGDLDSLKQQSFVSIIVAPLRNSKASSKVIETVAQLFMLPLAINGPSSMISEIKTIYIEVKLVPNLVYASRFLCRPPALTSSQSPQPCDITKPLTYRNITDLSAEELKTVSCLYELVCNLVHSNSLFLDQFCDAIAILGVNDLLINIISCKSDGKIVKRLQANIIALLSCVLRESPENSELVEKIIFSQRINFSDLLKDEFRLITYRALILLRLLGRFSCVALQKHWNSNIKVRLEELVVNPDSKIKNEALDIIEEFKSFPFF